MRRVGALALAVLVAAAGVFGLIQLLQGRDTATFSSVQGPGKLEPDRGKAHRAAQDSTLSIPPPTSGPHAAKAIPRDGVALDDDQVLQALEVGDVVLAYGDRGFTRALRSLAADVAGPFDSDLAAAGQAVILDPLSAKQAKGATLSALAGVTALAWRHRLQVASPQVPELRQFIEFWLGRGVE